MCKTTRLCTSTAVARGTLWVRRTWTRGRLGSPKGNRSCAVDLSPQAVEALRSWLSVRAVEAAVAGREAPAWVFPSPEGALGMTGGCAGTCGGPSFVTPDFVTAGC